MVFKVIKSLKKTRGFTLVEVMLSVAFLGILAVGISVVYSSGNQLMGEQLDRMLLDGQARSRMELLVGTSFNSVTSGSTVVAVNGKNYTVLWTSALTDLDGDDNPEIDAKEVTVTISGLTGYSLTTILVDNKGNINRL